MKNQSMLILKERIELMMKDPKIQAEMMKFENVEDGYQWITQVAIATLVIPQSKRK